MKNPKPKSPAVFLDRDGVLNFDSGYVYETKDLVLLPGVAAGLTRLSAHGFQLVVVTNQSGVARGYFTLDKVQAFHAALAQRIIAEGGPHLAHFYICPHHPDGSTAPFNVACSCRKPEPGLVEEALSSLNLDRERSFFIGDKPSDVHCGQRAGVKVIQIVGSRYEREGSADAVVTSFAEAVDFIVKNAR